jgi:hypothetical protein
MLLIIGGSSFKLANKK